MWPAEWHRPRWRWMKCTWEAVDVSSSWQSRTSTIFNLVEFLWFSFHSFHSFHPFHSFLFLWFFEWCFLVYMFLCNLSMDGLVNDFSEISIVPVDVTWCPLSLVQPRFNPFIGRRQQPSAKLRTAGDTPICLSRMNVTWCASTKQCHARSPKESQGVPRSKDNQLWENMNHIESYWIVKKLTKCFEHLWLSWSETTKINCQHFLHRGNQREFSKQPGNAKFSNVLIVMVWRSCRIGCPNISKHSVAPFWISAWPCAMPFCWFHWGRFNGMTGWVSLQALQHRTHSNSSREFIWKTHAKVWSNNF